MATGPGEMVENAAEFGQGAAELSHLRARPAGFLWRYVRLHPWGHAIVFVSVLVAVTCAVSAQYGLKHLIDISLDGSLDEEFLLPHHHADRGGSGGTLAGTARRS